MGFTFQGLFHKWIASIWHNSTTPITCHQNMKCYCVNQPKCIRYIHYVTDQIRINSMNGHHHLLNHKLFKNVILIYYTVRTRLSRNDAKYKMATPINVIHVDTPWKCIKPYQWSLSVSLKCWIASMCKHATKKWHQQGEKLQLPFIHILVKTYIPQWLNPHSR